MTDEELLKQMEEGAGFFHHNNYHVEKAVPGDVIVRVDLTEDSMNPYGIAHGGIIFGLGDVVMGMLAKGTGRKAVTLDANINYLRPGVGKYLKGQGEIIKDGNATCILQTSIYDDQERLVAVMRGTYYYIEQRKKESYE